MTWWTSVSAYVRDEDDLRFLAELFRIHLGSVIGRQIYPIVDTNPAKVKHPYTIDHNRRPGIVAVYIALLDPDHAPAQYEKSRSIAAEIAELKDPMSELNDTSQRLVEMLTILTQAWYRSNKLKSMRKKRNLRFALDAKTKMRIVLFAETLTRAAQIYRETLERNRILWDTKCEGYIGEICAQTFNFAFSIHYIKLAIKELGSQQHVREVGERDDGLDFGDIPDLACDLSNPVSIQSS